MSSHITVEHTNYISNRYNSFSSQNILLFCYWNQIVPGMIQGYTPSNRGKLAPISHRHSVCDRYREMFTLLISWKIYTYTQDLISFIV